MEAILFIAVMVGLVLALHKAREKGGELIHRAIRPGAYKKGKEVTTRVVALNAPVFRAPDIAVGCGWVIGVWLVVSGGGWVASAPETRYNC